jgi:hypothetical protein
MHWIALAIVFCFLMWRWPKKMMIGIAVIAVLGIIGGLGTYGYNHYIAYQKSLVTMEILRDDTNKTYILQINNNSSKTVNSVYYSIFLHPKGHSNRLDHEARTSYKIILPSGGAKQEHSVLKIGKYTIPYNAEQAIFPYRPPEKYNTMSDKQIEKAYEILVSLMNDYINFPSTIDLAEKRIALAAMAGTPFAELLPHNYIKLFDEVDIRVEIDSVVFNP